MHCANDLCYTLIISIFNFLIVIHFTNQITLKPGQCTKVKTYIQILHDKGTDKCSTLDPHGAYRMKGWKNVYKVLYNCFKILRWI